MSGKWKAAHVKCAELSAKYHADIDRQQSLLRAGEYVRTSALGYGEGSVRVLFRNVEGSVVGFSMLAATYHAIPLMTAATPDDYRQHGQLVEAPATFDDLYRAA